MFCMFSGFNAGRGGAQNPSADGANVEKTIDVQAILSGFENNLSAIVNGNVMKTNDYFEANSFWLLTSSV